MSRPRTGEAKPARVVTKSDVCKLLDVAPNTVKTWIDEGDHDWIVSRPSGKGGDYKIDMPGLVRWLKAKWIAAAEARAQRANPPAGGDGEEDPIAILLKDPEKRIKVGQAQVKFHKERQEIHMVADSKAMWEDAFGVMRQTAMAQADKIIRLFPGLEEAETRERYRQIQSIGADMLEEVAEKIRERNRGA